MRHLESIINCGLLEEINKSDYISVFEQLAITSQSYSPDAPIYFEGETMDKICIIGKGSVRSEKTYPDGEVHLIDVFEENAIFGLEISASRTKRAANDFISNEDSVIVFVSMESVEKSSQVAGIRKAIMQKLSDANVILGKKVEILAQKGIRDRLMVYFRILQSKSGKETFTIKMNREQMAQFLCVNRSALSNELSKMKREGIIEFKGKNVKMLK